MPKRLWTGSTGFTGWNSVVLPHPVDPVDPVKKIVVLNV
jgi:hypothetical protein